MRNTAHPSFAIPGFTAAFFYADSLVDGTDIHLKNLLAKGYAYRCVHLQGSFAVHCCLGAKRKAQGCLSRSRS